MQFGTYKFEYKVYYTTNPDISAELTFDLTLIDPCIVIRNASKWLEGTQWSPPFHVVHEDDIFEDIRSSLKIPRIEKRPAIPEVACEYKDKYFVEVREDLFGGIS